MDRDVSEQIAADQGHRLRGPTASLSDVDDHVLGPRGQGERSLDVRGGKADGRQVGLDLRTVGIQNVVTVERVISQRPSTLRRCAVVEIGHVWREA